MSGLHRNFDILQGNLAFHTGVPAPTFQNRDLSLLSGEMVPSCRDSVLTQEMSGHQGSITWLSATLAPWSPFLGNCYFLPDPMVMEQTPGFLLSQEWNATNLSQWTLFYPNHMFHLSYYCFFGNIFGNFYSIFFSGSTYFFMDPICIKLRIPESVPAREGLASCVVAFAWFLHFCAQLKSTVS